ncbi:hypothetical protein ACN38_g11654 [Penicillium nordicum]|uniref:Uncharacterized protein n=1 Tax=Penicillium nordicum TaxID=229535 RepID=A0A0M8NS08_9EURO|nr:hypothetical protein ACN38_g11654 [Penicillium nordicum]
MPARTRRAANANAFTCFFYQVAPIPTISITQLLTSKHPYLCLYSIDYMYVFEITPYLLLRTGGVHALSPLLVRAGMAGYTPPNHGGWNGTSGGGGGIYSLSPYVGF